MEIIIGRHPDGAAGFGQVPAEGLTVFGGAIIERHFRPERDEPDDEWANC